MVTGRAISRIRRDTFRADYPLDSALINSIPPEADQGGIYATIRDPGTHIIYKYLCEFTAEVLSQNNAKNRSTIRILDWGGGKGYVTYFLREMGFKVICYETDTFPHKAIWEKYKLDIVTNDGSSLPFSDQSFDAVVGFGVLEHVPYDYEALKELNRILTTEGLLFIFNLPSSRSYINRLWHLKKVFYHDRLYAPREVKGLLKRSGFKLASRIWYRQIFPKRLIHFTHYRLAERIDLWLGRYTPLKYIATDIEFVAKKQEAYTADH